MGVGAQTGIRASSVILASRSRSIAVAGKRILPLYIVLLAAFPLIDIAIQRSQPLTLGGSPLIWVAANLFPSRDLPHWINGQGRYVNPFAWQFLFRVGAVLVGSVTKHGNELPA
jgi:hypothetical protein